MRAQQRDLVSTDQVVTTAFLRDLLGFDEDDVLERVAIPTCAGQWLPEDDGEHWRAWEYTDELP